MHQFDRHLIQMVRRCLGGRLRSSSSFGLRLGLSCNGRRRPRRGNRRLGSGRNLALHQARVDGARAIGFFHIAGSGRRGALGDAFDSYAIRLFDELSLRHHIFHRNARTQRLGCGGRLRVLLRCGIFLAIERFAILGSEVFLANHLAFDNGSRCGGRDFGNRSRLRLNTFRLTLGSYTNRLGRGFIPTKKRIQTTAETGLLIFSHAGSPLLQGRSTLPRLYQSGRIR